MAGNSKDDKSTNTPTAAENQAQDAPAPAAPTPDQADEAKKAADLEKRAADLAEREAALNKKEADVAAIEARVDEKLGDVDRRIAELTRDSSKDAVTKNNEEKADMVKRQQALAYVDEDGNPIDLGELVDYTPLVTLANVSNAGTIVYEKGIKYSVPQQIVDDLRRREVEHLDYKENLHVRHDDLLNSGTISGGGK